MPVWYAILSMIGLALSAIIVDAKLAASEAEVYKYQGEFIFATVVLSISVVCLIGSSFWCVTSCRRKDEESPLLTTNDCYELLMDLAALTLGGLILALSAIILSLGSLVVNESSHTFAAVVVAVSSLTILIIMAKLIKQTLAHCETRVA
jgi:hypothetical protein